MRPLAIAQNAREGGGEGGALVASSQNRQFTKDGTIDEEPLEPRFITHRHWSIYEAMRCSDYVSTRLDTWKTATPGVPSSLDLLLALCGCSPSMATTFFPHVSKKDRNNFFEKLYAAVRDSPLKWQMSAEELFYPSFTRTLDLSEPVMSAADYVYALEGHLSDASADSAALDAISKKKSALGEGEGEGERWDDQNRQGSGGMLVRTPASASPTSSWLDTWQFASQALSRKNTELLDKGILKAQSLRKAILDTLPNLHRGNRVRANKYFRVVDVGEDLNDTERRLFLQPLALAELGRYIIRVYRDSLKQWRHSNRHSSNEMGDVRTKPLLVYLRQKRGSALYAKQDDGGWITIMALPVQEEGAEAQLMLKVQMFEVADVVKAPYHFDSFDNNCMVIRADNFMNFMSHFDLKLREFTINAE